MCRKREISGEIARLRRLPAANCDPKPNSCFLLASTLAFCSAKRFNRVKIGVAARGLRAARLLNYGRQAKEQ